MIHWATSTFSQGQLAHVLFSNSISVDLSIFELFSPLTTGGQVHLAENVLQLPQLAQAEQITLINTVPSVLKALVEQHALPDSLQVINLSGETLKQSLVEQLYAQPSMQAVYNLYGSSEDTVYSTSALMASDGIPHIGKPLSNTCIHLLDNHQQPVPIGIAGELCITGDGLARGYLNQPDLTAERFITVELFGKVERLYKTGDLARWLPDGNLEYLGRIDQQIRLRGFHIELGKIEAVLSQHEAVEDCVVVLDEREGHQSLAAYVTINNAQSTIHNDQLDLDPYAVFIAHLKSQLPDYMVPSSLTILDKLPLTLRGKIDYEALPAPNFSASTSPTNPRNRTELQLMTVWEQVLQTHPIGVHDNFFELGGYSLLAVKLISHLTQEFQRPFSLSLLLKYPTIAEFAQHVHDETAQQDIPYLIPIQLQGTQKPIYALPGIGGNVLYFHLLATHIGQDQPFYGLEAPGLQLSDSIPDSIEDHASRILNSLRQHQPTGPYRLLGHSAGSSVALELAYQLEQQGESVEQLIILDTPAPNDWYDEIIETPEEILWFLVNNTKKRFGVDVGITQEIFDSFPDELSRYQYVMQRLQSSGVLFAPNASVEELQRLVSVNRTTQINLQAYHPTIVLNAPVTLIKAQEALPNMPEALQQIVQTDYWGWQNFSRQPVQIYDTAGSHQTMLTMPAVQDLAEALIGLSVSN